MTQVKRLYIADKGGAPLKPIQTAKLVANAGIEGDRYFNRLGTFTKKAGIKPEQQLTLIEMEEIDQFNQARYEPIDYGDFRRNVLTQGVRLNDLVGKEFSIGNVRLKGIELCEPCAYLSKLLGPEVMSEMLHKCGLRAQILNDGEVQADDIIQI